MICALSVHVVDASRLKCSCQICLLFGLSGAYPIRSELVVGLVFLFVFKVNAGLDAEQCQDQRDHGLDCGFEGFLVLYNAASPGDAGDAISG